MSDGLDDSSTNSTDPAPVIALAATNASASIVSASSESQHQPAATTRKPGRKAATMRRRRRRTCPRSSRCCLRTLIPVHAALGHLAAQPHERLQPMFQLTIDGVQSDIYNPFNSSNSPATTNNTRSLHNERRHDEFVTLLRLTPIRSIRESARLVEPVLPMRVRMHRQ